MTAYLLLLLQLNLLGFESLRACLVFFFFAGQQDAAAKMASKVGMDTT